KDRSRQAYAEKKKRKVAESWTRDADVDASNWRTWKMAPPQSDESPVDMEGGQADDEPEIQFPPLLLPS
ncbi:hypothetical protein ACJX0J_025441, partial [Zea mays]